VSTAALNARFGSNLKSYRGKASFTQSQLAEAVDLSLRYLQELEAGQKVPSLLTVVRLAKALKISIGDLTEGLAATVSVPNPSALALPRIDRRKSQSKKG